MRKQGRPLYHRRVEASTGGEAQLLALKGGWTARLTAEALEFSKAGTQESRQLPRAQALELVERVWLRFPRQPFLVVRKPNRLVIKMSEEQARVIDGWLGDDFGPELNHLLRTRMSYAIPAGAFYFVSSHYDWTTWTFGSLLVAEGILFRLRPSHWLLLLDSAFWVALLARNVISFATNPGVLNAAFGFLSYLLLSVSIRTFRVLHAAHRARTRLQSLPLR